MKTWHWILIIGGAMIATVITTMMILKRKESTTSEETVDEVMRKVSSSIAVGSSLGTSFKINEPTDFPKGYWDNHWCDGRMVGSGDSSYCNGIIKNGQNPSGGK